MILKVLIVFSITLICFGFSQTLFGSILFDGVSNFTFVDEMLPNQANCIAWGNRNGTIHFSDTLTGWTTIGECFVFEKCCFVCLKTCVGI